MQQKKAREISLTGLHQPKICLHERLNEREIELLLENERVAVDV